MCTYFDHAKLEGVVDVSDEELLALAVANELLGVVEQRLDGEREVLHEIAARLIAQIRDADGLADAANRVHRGDCGVFAVG